MNRGPRGDLGAPTKQGTGLENEGTKETARKVGNYRGRDVRRGKT